jgi:hypothetical protein
MTTYTQPLNGREFQFIAGINGDTRIRQIENFGSHALVEFLEDDKDRGIKAGEIKDVDTFILL